MLITQLKAKETITSLTAGKKVFIINCHGCKEVRFPEKEAVELQKELAAEGNVTGIMTTDYICNPENMELRLKKHMSKIQEADLVLVFSCGVGVQTVAEYLDNKMVCAACDTYPVYLDKLAIKNSPPQIRPSSPKPVPSRLTPIIKKLLLQA